MSELQYPQWTRSENPINVTDENQKLLKDYFRKINLTTVHEIYGAEKQDYLQVGDNEKACWFTVMIKDRRGILKKKPKIWNNPGDF